MTPKQKLIITALAVANAAVILTLVGVVAGPIGRSTPSSSPSSTPISPQPTCQATPHPMVIWQATRLLAQAGLGGTVTLTPAGSLRFDIVTPDRTDQTASAPEIEAAVDEAAQSVWTAFDIALAIQAQAQETGAACAAFTQVEVTVLVRGDQTDTQVQGKVSMPDLMAYNAGELSENQFVERVTYGVNVASNE
jgi:hypothetical protein